MSKVFTDLIQTTSSENANSNKIRILFRILAISLAGMHTWAAITSQSMNADGISYLDIGDAYFRGDWQTAINPVWPPLYSWILGGANFILKPSMAWEFPIVHLINFVIFLVALVCFEFMWGRLRDFTDAGRQDGSVPLPGWTWWAVGYSLFIWTSLGLIQIWSVTPDLLTAALIFLAAGLIIDIRFDSGRWRPFLYLGIILGLGYLAKTFMFSIGLVFLGMCLLLVQPTWSSIGKISLTAGVFLLITIPFIFLISEQKGKLTIGEAGTVTYLRYVHGIPFPHWQGDPTRQIVPAHPSRLVYQSPPIYEFGEPIGGTYPISTDPSYWFDGIQMRFNLGNQLARIFSSVIVYLDLFLVKQGLFTACVIALVVMSRRQKLSLLEITRKWILVIPAVIAFVLYGLVLVAGRYVGVFILLFWADVLANIRLADSANNRLWLRVLSAIAILGVMVPILIFNLDGFNRLNPSIQSNISGQITLKPARPLEVALALQQLGLQEGDRVAIIGYGFDSFWARLARVKIVAEMLDLQANEFWLGDEALQNDVLQAFASTGAEAVVAENAPDYARLEGWHQVGESNYYIHLLTEQ